MHLPKKEREALTRNQIAELRENMTREPEPARDDLEKTLEANEKCATCQGAVRAICDGWEPTRADITCDGEVRTTLYCRNAACGWTVTQYRPWCARSPKEI